MATDATSIAIDGIMQFPCALESFPRAWPPLHRFSVADYQRLIEAGILADDERVVLLDGWIFNMAPPGPMHSSIVSHFGMVLARTITDEWHIRFEQPIALSTSAPQPDLAVVRGRALDYVEKYPVAQQTALVVEIASSSLVGDRDLKASLYAAAGLSLYWIVDLKAKQVEVLCEPQAAALNLPAHYRSRQMVGLSGELSLTLDEAELRIPVARLFS